MWAPDTLFHFAPFTHWVYFVLPSLERYEHKLQIPDFTACLRLIIQHKVLHLALCKSYATSSSALKIRPILPYLLRTRKVSQSIFSPKGSVVIANCPWIVTPQSEICLDLLLARWFKFHEGLLRSSNPSHKHKSWFSWCSLATDTSNWHPLTKPHRKLYMRLLQIASQFFPTRLLSAPPRGEKLGSGVQQACRMQAERTDVYIFWHVMCLWMCTKSQTTQFFSMQLSFIRLYSFIGQPSSVISTGSLDKCLFLSKVCGYSSQF